MAERSQFELSGDFGSRGNLESLTKSDKGPSDCARSLAMSVGRYFEVGNFFARAAER